MQRFPFFVRPWHCFFLVSGMVSSLQIRQKYFSILGTSQLSFFFPHAADMDFREWLMYQAPVLVVRFFDIMVHFLGEEDCLGPELYA